MMKKLLIVVSVVIVAALAVSGCIQFIVETPPSTKSSPPAVPIQPQTSPPPFVAITVNSATTNSEIGSYPLQSTPSPGRMYLVLDVTITNQNRDRLYMGNPTYFKLITSNGTVYSYATSTFDLQNPINGVYSTNPGDKVTGNIAFEIPQSATATQLIYSDPLNGEVSVNLIAASTPVSFHK